MFNSAVPLLLFLSLLLTTLVPIFSSQTIPVVQRATPRQFIAITGLTTRSTARILYYSPDNDVKVSLYEDEDLIAQFEWANTPSSPKVNPLQGLKQDTSYKVTLQHAPNASPYTLHFRTLGASHVYRASTNPFKIITLSCDRYFDDQDESMWHNLLRSDPSYDLMVHLGDQIYADRIWKQRDENTTTVAQFLEEFRNLYHLYLERDVIREVFSRGAHVFLPDDHDIINNLNRDFVASAQHDTAKRNFVIAGRIAYLEYQYQLMADIPDHFSLEDISQSVDVWNFDLQVDGLCLFFLDTRFETTFRYDPEYPLLGKRQHLALMHALTQCPEQSKIILFSSIPLAQFDEYCAKLVYVAEKEIYASHPKVSNETLRLFDELTPYTTRTLLVGGDIHQYLKTRLIRYSRESEHQQGAVLHFATSSGMSQDSRVLSEMKIFLFNLLVHYFSYGWIGQWRLDHYTHHFSKNYMTISRGQKDHTYDLDGLRYVGALDPLTDRKEIILNFIFNHFVLVEIVIVLAVGILGQYLFAYPGNAEEELRLQKEKNE